MDFGVRAVTAATAATIDHAIANLWNPSATARLNLFEVTLFKKAAGAANDAIYLRRTTTRGTPGSTVTPGIQHNYDRVAAPPSGAVVDLAAFTAQPTMETGGFWAWVSAAVSGSGFVYPIPRTIDIPPGSGIAIVTAQATAWPISEVAYAWEE